MNLCRLPLMFSKHRLIYKYPLLSSNITRCVEKLMKFPGGYFNSSYFMHQYNHKFKLINGSYSSSKNGQANNQTKVMFIISSIFAFSLLSSQKEENEEEKKEEKLITMMKMGILALQRGEHNKSEQLLHIALRTAQETHNEQGITYIYDLMANIAFQKQEFTKAEQLYKEVLKRMLSAGMQEDDNALVEVSLKLASLYASLEDNEKANQGFQFCIGTQNEKIKNSNGKDLDEDTKLLWAMSMDWYARFLLNIGKYESAKTHFVQAYEMCEKINGANHHQTAVLLNDIGSVCSLLKDYELALEYLIKAIDAARESRSPDIGSFYVNLASVYIQKEMYGEAERCCREGLLLAKKMDNVEAEEEANSCLKEIQILTKK